MVVSIELGGRRLRGQRQERCVPLSRLQQRQTNRRTQQNLLRKPRRRRRLRPATVSAVQSVKKRPSCNIRQESARKLTRARVLLKADEDWTDAAISDALDVGTATVERVRKRFVEWGGIQAIERRKPRRRYERKLDGEGEARLVALACSAPPEGRERWTLQLLADELVALEAVDIESISYETVRRVLKKKEVLRRFVG